MRPLVRSPWLGICTISITSGAFFVAQAYIHNLSFSDQEADFEIIQEQVETPLLFLDPYANWKRPDGPLRVGLQAGHWNASEAPDELEKLRVNTGASAGGITEWETNLKIAQETKKLLEANGIVVDLLPTTIPPDYWADAFVAIHADGNKDTSVSGYKIAAPYRDRTGKAETLMNLMSDTYEKSTGLAIDPNITRNMRGYYAFNWRKYEHSIHPMTPAVIVETGFLTNSSDRRLIYHHSQKSAQGIADAVLSFLKGTTSSTRHAP
jgi:hypothetical protein